jgi:hydroxymethylpyrimidine pyrophosphatase-like HAD family hydrolase
MIEDEYLIEESSYNRLLAEYYKHGSLCIGFDFDGTVHDYHKRGVMYPKVIQLLKDLRSIGCRLICWTAFRDHAYIINYLEANDIPFDGVNIDGLPLPYETRKPFFSALLDDRAGLRQVYQELTKLVTVVKSGIYGIQECG